MATDTKNVFISHVHEDDPGLAKLKGLLKDNGMVARDYSISSDNPNNAHNDDYIKGQILAPRIRQFWCSHRLRFLRNEGQRLGELGDRICP